MNGSGDGVLRYFLSRALASLCWHSKIICAILVDGIMRNISVKIFNLDQWFRRKGGLKIFLIQGFGGTLVQLSGAICANLVEGIIRNISV